MTPSDESNDDDDDDDLWKYIVSETWEI
jgi:hypothetical protein